MARRVVAAYALQTDIDHGEINPELLRLLSDGGYLVERNQAAEYAAFEGFIDGLVEAVTTTEDV